MKRVIYFSVSLSAVIMLVLIILNPNVCKSGAISGLLLSGNVIIPSLFPFAVFVLFILKSNLPQKLHIKSDISIFILSLIGGYPIGAKLLNEALETKIINKNDAEKMLNYCVNAGPAFIILAVGGGLLNSQKLGYILFVSHILASIILMALTKTKSKESKQKNDMNIIDNFVLSVSQAASATFSICSFIILFSVILSYINFYTQKFEILKSVSYILEVTNACAKTKNIYLISFLLGFSGICIWFQVWGMVKHFKINYLKFAICRILHGLLSTTITFIIIKVFKIALPTLSNGINAGYALTATAPAIAISLIIMGIIFIISLNTKNYAGNLLEDLV